MRHNHVENAEGRRDGSYWAAGLCTPSTYLPGGGSPGGVLAQVQGPVANSCRVLLAEAEAPLFADALLEAARAAEAGHRFMLSRSVAGQGHVSTWRVAADEGRVRAELENQFDDRDEVSLSSGDARDFAAEVRHNLERLLSDETRAEVESMGRLVAEMRSRGEWPPTMKAA